MPVSIDQWRGKIGCFMNRIVSNFFFFAHMMPDCLLLIVLFCILLRKCSLIFLWSIQYDAAIAITGTIRGTLSEKLFRELGLQTLKSRRWFRKLYLFYKMLHSKSPTTMDIILWEFFMFYQNFLSPQVRWSLIISNKLVYTSCRTT